MYYQPAASLSSATVRTGGASSRSTRLSRTDTSEVENLGGWLTQVVARVALNMLRARNTRREQPLDVRVPDPIIDPTEGSDPEHEALLADSVALAILLVLETLSPSERLASVLHGALVNETPLRSRVPSTAILGRPSAASASATRSAWS